MRSWSRNYQEILFFLCGNYGILCFWEKLSGIACMEGVVCLWMAVITVVLWYVCFYRRRQFAVVAAIVAAGVFMAVLVGRNTFLQQAEHMWRAATGTAGTAQQDVTFLFLLAMTGVVSVLFFLEFIWKKHGVSCLLMIAMLMLGPVLGIASSYRAVLFLALFQIAFFMQGLKRTAGILTGVTFGIVFLAVSFCQEALYHSAYQAEYFGHNALMYLTGRADEAVSDGHINRGNRYETGAVQLEIETYELPSEILYLRGFSGDQYTGGEWRQADNTELLEQAAQILGLHERINTVSTMYGGMYYTLNSFLSEDGIKNSRNIRIVHPSGKYISYFEPYGGQWTSETTYSMYLYSGYTYRYYEQADMKIDWSNVSDAFSSQAAWYGNLQDAYMEVVNRECLDVPRERLPRLTELCETHQLENLNEITAFITSALEAGAVYTQTPGNTPMNKDVVEYFLFDNGKGYCQHFASAAVLMYRLYGVPARYAVGYKIEPSDFQLEKGVYRAYVTDEAAHAWVEIFVKDYGWVPVEVTPQDDGNIRPFYPGIDMTDWEQLLQEYQWDFALRFPGPEAEVQDTIDNTWEWDEIPWENYEEILRILAVMVVYTLVLTPLFIKYRRLRWQERFYDEDCCEHYRRLVRMLHSAGYLVDCDGAEEDFARRLAEEFPEIGTDDIEHMVNIAEKAAYGRPQSLSRMEDAFVKALCREISKQISGRSKCFTIHIKLLRHFL